MGFRSQAFGYSVTANFEAVSLTGPATNVGETREIKGFWLALPQTFLKVIQETLRIRPILNPQDEIISLADSDSIAVRIVPSPLMCPLVQNVMQIHVASNGNITAP